MAGGELVDRFLPGPMIGNKNGVLADRLDELRGKLRASRAAKPRAPARGR